MSARKSPPTWPLDEGRHGAPLRSARDCRTGQAISRRRGGALRRRPSSLCLAGLVLLVGAMGCDDRGQPVSLAFELIRQDPGMNRVEDGKPAPPAYHLFRDPTSWKAHWEEIGTTAVPPVQFDHQVVLWVSMGTQPTGGYSVELRDVRFDPERQRLRCTLEWSEPASGSMRIQAMTVPSAIYRIALPPEVGMQASQELQVEFCHPGQGEEAPIELQQVH